MMSEQHRLVKKGTKAKQPQWLVGVDEVGRGPLAGPVYVGVFAIPRSFNVRLLHDVADSKQLRERPRKQVYERIIHLCSVRYAVAYTRASTIDTIGIVPSVSRAIRSALKKLAIPPHDCVVLLDGGLTAPKRYPFQRTIVKGDQKEKVIGAASIIAKVTRDKVMKRLAVQYPKYGFGAHKGYGTSAHIDALLRHGLSPHHRKTFCTSLKKRRSKTV